MTVRRSRSGATLFAALLSLACTERRASPNATTQPSPNASILPAPLASAADLAGATAQGSAAAAAESSSAGRAASGEPEPPPESAPTDRALAPDPNGARDATGYTMEASFRWADTPPLASGPDIPATLKDVAARVDLKVVVELSANGRMRFALESDGFPLPIHSELRARTAYYGNVLLWPGALAYRVVPAGSLRALFAERRADVSPLLRAVVRAGGSGSLLGHRTVQTELETSLGVLLLEQETSALGTGGELLCRFLVELLGAEPASDACRPERVPLFAQWRWSGGGSLAFAVTSIADRKDPTSTDLAVPPDTARWAPGELPVSPAAVLTHDELVRLRSRPMRAAVPNAKVTEGVTFANETSLVQYLFLDGLPAMWLLPHTRAHLPEPPAGKYQVAFRDFLGTAVTPPSTVELPAFVRVGVAEADAAPRQ